VDWGSCKPQAPVSVNVKLFLSGTHSVKDRLVAQTVVKRDSRQMLALANMVASREPSNILSISDLSPSRGKGQAPKSLNKPGMVKFGDGA
jgi:hypothetical protein